MSRIVFCWELGYGLGHVIPYVPLWHRLQKEKGHELFLVMRDLTMVDFLKEKGIEFTAIKAPDRPPYQGNFSSGKVFSYTNIIQNVMAQNYEICLESVEKWRRIFDVVQPQLLIAESSPTALLSAKTLNFVPKIIVGGTGFSIPPDVDPLPNIKYWNGNSPSLKILDESVIHIINKILTHFRKPTFKQISDLYNADFKILKTIPELDPFPTRHNVFYYGSWPSDFGEEVEIQSHPSIFLYMRTSSYIEILLKILSTGMFSSVVYVEGLADAMKTKYNHPSITYLNKPANLSKMMRKIDLAITHGSLNTTVNFLLNETPVLIIPEHLEQLLTGKLVERMKCGTFLSIFYSQTKRTILSALNSDVFQKNVDRLSKKYSEFTEKGATDYVINKVEEIMAHD